MGRLIIMNTSCGSIPKVSLILIISLLYVGAEMPEPKIRINFKAFKVLESP